MEKETLRSGTASDRERIRALYRQLHEEHGPQGWWPLGGRAGRPSYDEHGYHRGSLQAPLTVADRFEIVMGAVLTQNTAWTNVESALGRLRRARIRLPKDVRAVNRQRLAGLIRPAGYFNQKARKLRLIAAFFSRPGALSGRPPPGRDDLLSLWGIGPETADSILLYAFRVPVFVVDAYTRRLLSRVGVLSGREGYEEIQGVFHRALGPSATVYNELHALIVAHAKRYCRARPLCRGCPVSPCAWGDHLKDRIDA